MGTEREALWAAAVAGDRGAFAVFYRRHADAVYRHVRARVGCRVDAEDLTAEVFLVAWRRRHHVRVDPVAGVLPWLLTTANNLVRGHYRSETRAGRAWSRLSPPAGGGDALDGLIEVEQEQHLRRCLQASLDQLRPGERRIIELRFIHGMAHVEIAGLLGLSVGTTRGRLHRALGKARKYFAAFYAAERLDASPVGGGDIH